MTFGIRSARMGCMYAPKAELAVVPAEARSGSCVDIQAFFAFVTKNNQFSFEKNILLLNLSYSLLF